MSEAEMGVGEAQARRLEAIQAEIEEMLNQPDVAQRLRTAPGENEWSALQILGHVNEIIPYWLNHCSNLIAAEGEPPAFGRTLDSPERLEAVARVDRSDVDGLLAELRREVAAGAAMMRRLTPEERAKEGIHNRLGQITVEKSIESFVLEHGEDHAKQIRTALGL
jgi:DinB superfamily